MIFRKDLALNSLATGPKMRVPIGSLLLLINTAEFSSKRRWLPSDLRIECLVLTITALVIEPFLTLDVGKASLTVTTIISPMEAVLRRLPPKTFMHWIFLAPELSAT